MKGGLSMKRWLIIVLLFILSTFSLIGCADNEAMVPMEDQTLNAVDNTPIEEEKAEFYAPLTGLPTDEQIDNRIIGVMINNHSKARPQSGLLEADMVYEVLAEGMITRFVAIYQSQEADLIGPVRSIRPYYIDIINGFDAYLVHSGSSQEALATLQNSNLPDIDEIENAGGAFWRVDFRKAPHNLYTNTALITSFAEKRGYRTEGYVPEFIFLEEDEKIEGESAIDISIKYASDYIVGYQYDEQAGVYKRYINGKPHTDYETGKQLTATNILVARADHQILDSEGRRKVDVYGPGDGYLFQNGKVIAVEWKRVDGVIRAFVDGKEQGLIPGQTWTLIVENRTEVLYK